MSRVEEVLRDAESLEPDDRLRLIARLWASLPPDHWAAPGAYQLAEIRRQFGGDDADPVDDAPWDALRWIMKPRLDAEQVKLYHATRRFDADWREGRRRADHGPAAEAANWHSGT